MSTALAEQSPTSTLDPYADEALLNPWPLYGELREMGPVVWLERYGMFALTRYDAVGLRMRSSAAHKIRRLSMSRVTSLSGQMM